MCAKAGAGRQSQSGDESAFSLCRAAYCLVLPFFVLDIPERKAVAARGRLPQRSLITDSMHFLKVGDCPSASLYAGDCFTALQILPDASVDLVVTDPPFGTTNLAFDKEARKNRIDWDAWWLEIHRVTTPQAIICSFAAQPFTTDLINSNRKYFRYAMVWHKTNAVGFLSANQRPLRAHEDILIFCRKFGARREGQQRVMQSVYNPQFTEGTPYTHHYRAQKATHYSATKVLPTYRNEGRRHPTSVLTYGRDRPSLHPTAKPQELCRFLIRSFSHAGQTVLDPFCGSGSTIKAALLEGRNTIGVELDPVHFETTRQGAEDILKST